MSEPLKLPTFTCWRCGRIFDLFLFDGMSWCRICLKPYIGRELHT